MIDIKNKIAREIIILGDFLKREYSNSELDFDIYIQRLLSLLHGEKVSVAFIFKDGHIQKEIIPKAELTPIFEMLKRDPLNLAKMNSIGKVPTTKQTSTGRSTGNFIKRGGS